MITTMRIADCALRHAQGGLRLSKAGLRTGLRIGFTVLAASATLVAQAPRPQPGVRLPMPQLEAQMFHVSAGKRLKPAQWPNGARVAVGLSFDVDNATADLATGNLISESISRGEYGAVDGLPRILRLLDKHQLPASFFIPAVSHLLHPEMIPSILKSGRHEIGVHGWIHEHLPSVNDGALEQELLTRAIETLTKAIGKKPVGYRAPSWQFSQWTVKQVKDAGFLYDSSLMASDDAYEILLDKQPTGASSSCRSSASSTTSPTSAAPPTAGCRTRI
jgi:peptidoglycan-N-acetylglucosamine deacetylase